MLFQKNASLKPYNTFGLDVKAKELYTVLQQSDLIELKNKGVFEQKHLILGGGSNVLLTSDFNGTVVLIKTQGKKKINTQTENLVEVEFAAGEVWHQCVMWAIENNYGGLENLSLIPGTTGAAPMQNIGAYGVEIKDTFMSLSAFNKATGKFETFNNAACEFGYRESIFKHRLKNQYIICNVRFGLTIGNHNLNTSYGAIANVLNQKGIINPSIQNISEAVIEIRQSKLPDPKQIGNSGSFFKNPIVQKSVAEKIKIDYPNMPMYAATNNQVKLAAGWLIEKCGYKGKRVGQTGSHAKQALVLVNYGNAKGADVWQLALEIKAAVKQKFGVEIQPEVNVI